MECRLEGVGPVDLLQCADERQDWTPWRHPDEQVNAVIDTWLAHRWCPQVWLEDDASGTAHAYLTVVPTYPVTPTSRRPTWAEQDAAVRSMIADEDADALRVLVSSGPVTLVHVGTVRRGRPHTRALFAVPTVKALPWLREQGWPGELDAARDLLHLAARGTSMVSLQLDVIEGALGPRLAVEFYPVGLPMTHPHWTAFLDRLVAMDLAGRCQAEDLQRWASPLQDVHEGRRRTLLRDVDVKVTLEADGQFHAKGYLSARWA